MLDVYTEIEEELAKEGNLYRIHYAKEVFEQKRGHVSSAVECYMKEFGVTEEEASIGLCRQASDAWKDINESLLLPNAVSRTVLTRIHCITCAIDVVYKYGDGYTAPDDTLKNLIASTLIEQVPL
ncbi:hypothetical protein ACLB2K_022108 [Fragaria x ananassa]